MLQGVRGLTHPEFHKMTLEDRLLHACLLAYQVFHCGNVIEPEIKVTETIHNAICEALGDDGYEEWTGSFDYEAEG